MELVGREPLDVLGVGDCSESMEEFSREKMKAALRTNILDLSQERDPAEEGRCPDAAIPNCQVQSLHQQSQKYISSSARCQSKRAHSSYFRTTKWSIVCFA